MCFDDIKFVVAFWYYPWYTCCNKSARCVSSACHNRICSPHLRSRL